MAHYQEKKFKKRIQADSTLVLSDIYQAYVKDIFLYCQLTVGNRETAEDLTQETFIKANYSLSNYDSKRASVRTWLHRIAYHLCIDYLRKKKRQSWYQRIFHSKEPHSQPIDQIHIHLSIQPYLQRLTEEQRSIVILAYYHEMKGNEIAEILRLPIGTVKSRLHYSLRKLKKWMKEDEI